MNTRQVIPGFDILAERELAEYRVQGTHLRHGRTGCEVLHLATTDQENLFAFCFATPPGDDTGVAHIIEHSVLSGSVRYPVKEPFSVLMKGSMHTFLNALTYPDRTVYPAASCNRADFFNLMTVYGDAVFHPLLRTETFMQEAWRLEESVEGGGAESLRYAGIVYNEMKGAYSSHDAVVSEWMTRSLLPDTPYRFDSGGDPAFIPSLTFDAARKFHAAYYHPSNCRIFLYGDIPLKEILDYLQTTFLSEFSTARPAPVTPLQAPWKAPRRLEKTFPVKKDTPLEGRSSVTLGWLLPPVTGALDIVTSEVLSGVLVESAGSPLRKALVDSGLGEDLSPVSGLENDLKQMIFAVGLRGTEPAREEAISHLVLETLDSLARKGLDPRLVESMINRVEFRHREIRGNGSPYALRLMGRALRGWMHGANPFTALEFAGHMGQLKARIASDPSYLAGRLSESFVKNPHRLTLVVRPDREQEERDAAAEKGRLSATVKSLSSAEMTAVLDSARVFREFQMAPDSPELIARIPSVRRADLPRQVERIPLVETRTPHGVSLALHDIFTNEIVSLDLGFATDGLSVEQSLMLPLFGRVICGAGLPGSSYDTVALELFRLTGGFSANLDAGGIVGDPGRVGQYMFFRMRCLRTTLAEAVDLVARLLSTADLKDTTRLRDLLLELRNDMKAALVPNGHHFAMLRAASMISEAVAREEQWRGISQLLFLQERAAAGDAELDRIGTALEGIRRDLLTRKLLFANATAAADAFPEIATAVDRIADRLSPGSAREAAAPVPGSDVTSAGGLAGESLITSASVGYVARAVPGFRFEHPLNGPGAVLGHLLSTGYLWEKIRMEGGAYGAFSYPRNTDGLFLFGSYRDPHICSTIRAFSDGLELMEKGSVDESEVEKAVIGTVGREDRPIDPGEKGFVSLQRRLHGVTDEARQARRDALLAVDRQAVSEAARALRAGFSGGFTSVIANRRSLAEAAAENPELGGRILDLPE